MPPVCCRPRGSPDDIGRFKATCRDERIPTGRRNNLRPRLNDLAKKIERFTISASLERKVGRKEQIGWIRPLRCHRFCGRSDRRAGVTCFGTRQGEGSPCKVITWIHPNGPLQIPYCCHEIPEQQTNRPALARIQGHAGVERNRCVQGGLGGTQLVPPN